MICIRRVAIVKTRKPIDLIMRVFETGHSTYAYMFVSSLVPLIQVVPSVTFSQQYDNTVRDSTTIFELNGGAGELDRCN